jgi:D-glycero-D-manno-heptose 1,7-bisphosphate phosphatase
VPAGRVRVGRNQLKVPIVSDAPPGNSVRIGMPSPLIRRPAVFLDRDGVINTALVRDGRPYPPRSLSEFKILDDVPQACAKLKSAGFLLVVATNQPDVGRGTLSRDVVEEIHRFMSQQLALDRVEVCYHPGKGQSGCSCRKPKPGMLLHAANELGIDLGKSWMVGDRWRDIDCGHAAQCRTIFIDRGYNEPLRQNPDYRANGLLEASELILNVDLASSNQ